MHVTFEGKKVHLEQRGESSSGQTPFVFVHGAGGSHLTWEQLYSHWDQNWPGVPAIFPSLPGHLESEGPPLTSIRETADWLHRFLEHMYPGQPVILLGHSMGGAIAQQMALSYPQQLKGIILLTTGAKLGTRPEFLEALRRGEYDPQQTRNAFSPHTDPAIIESVIARRANTPVEVIYQDFLNCNAFDLREDIRNIRVPTLIIAGEDDVLTPPMFSTFMAERIPGAELVILEKAGHYVPAEQPETFEQLIRNFYNQQAS